MRENSDSRTESNTDKVIERNSSLCSLPSVSQKFGCSLAVLWTKGICPNCGYANADVDSEGILWCPACGYSKKGCYT
jgi:hypothetical protein